MSTPGDLYAVIKPYVENPPHQVFQRHGDWTRVISRIEYSERLRMSRRREQVAAIHIDDCVSVYPNPVPVLEEPAVFKENGLEFTPTRAFYAKVDNWPRTFPAHFVARALLPSMLPPSDDEVAAAFLFLLRLLGFSPHSAIFPNNPMWYDNDLHRWLKRAFPAALLLFKEVHRLVGPVLAPLAHLEPAKLKELYEEKGVPSQPQGTYPSDWLFRDPRSRKGTNELETSVVEYVGAAKGRLSAKGDRVESYSFLQLEKPTQPLARTDAEKGEEKPCVFRRAGDWVRGR
ncbi:hypothetical protein JCM6882_003247 [Rhodosporidiobolus microsporus]